ncbi:acireductone dioxygenase [Mycobacterium cookii]|uniref:Acireductone dioxygenase n=1 Tax=Mycobacterium cookii TaxID=1775 RepID=A0A7I7KU80_9MYCO|nr:cupin [Mycobacterium cookii]MCV7328751.1 cupin [Mycobacterium cookii]BBX45377.1 acireductone dioxygenase [Mycobacterium cookii]
MTLLQVMADVDAADVRLRTDKADLIADELVARGIAFDHWPVAADLDADRPAEQILAECAQPIAAINRDGRYRHVDVTGLRPDDRDPDWQATASTARSKFLAEHRHAEDEVRFFVAGRGCFYLHLEPEVLAVVCESGDVLSVPAGTRHWFDMGSRPDFAAIRFFEREDGWIGYFTGDVIGQRFPTLDQLVTT